MVTARRFVVEAARAGQRLDRVLAELLAPVSRTAVQRAIVDGVVRVDGQTRRAKDKLSPGETIVVGHLSEPVSTLEPDSSVAFELLYEDDDLLVVDKPPGVVVHPSRGHWTGSLVAGLIARPGFRRDAADPRDPEGHNRPGVVHRIDKDTSGLLVVAKHARAREGLKAQLSAHTVERAYEALTVGVPDAGRIDTLHGRHPRSRLRFSCAVPEGKRAVTHVVVRQTYGRAQAACVQCRLETGRTHQIRVHLADARKTPLLADALYGGSRVAEPLRPALVAIGRQALHARVLGFEHPVSGCALRFEAPPPPDFQAAQKALEAL